MKTIFVDAYYFIAVLNPRDSAHGTTTAVSQANWQHIVTTEWVLVETANAISSPPLRDKFIELVDKLRMRPNVEIVYSSKELFEEGLELFRRRSDKHWSLTDCLSFCVMKRRGITEALTADSHFEQAGFSAMLR